MRQSSKLHDFLSSEYFVRTGVKWILGFSIVTKVAIIPGLYINLNNEEELKKFPKNFCLIFLFNMFVCSGIRWFSWRFRHKEWEQDEIKWRYVFLDYNTYANIFDILAHIVIPLYLITSVEIFALPHLIIGSLLVTMNAMVLYAFFTCDFLPFIEHNEEMQMDYQYEANYEPPIMSIIESTPDYIAIKNMTYLPMRLDFELTRRTSRRVTDQRTGTVNQVTDSFVKVEIQEDNLSIPPYSVFKVIPQEYKGDDEYLIPVKGLRSFGPKKGETIITSLKFSNEEENFNVELIQYYKKKEEVKNVETMDPRKYSYRPVPPSEID